MAPVVDRKALEEAAHDIAEKVRARVPRNAGFALVLFDYTDHGPIAYISNGNRRDVVEKLRQLTEKIEIEAEE